MCLLLIAKEVHPEYKLIVAANRDEFYSRPALPAAFWKDHPELLAGKDLEAGGTWLGITRSGRFSAITNYRDFHKAIKNNAPSRGKLTTDFLFGDDSPSYYTKKLQEHSSNYNGFNLVYGIKNDLYYFSNQSDAEIKLECGIYGLSNALLDTPWPKVEKSKKRFAEILMLKKDVVKNLFDLLYDKEIAEDKLLPDTGIGMEKEKALSSIFIMVPDYGTRCSTVLLVGQDDKTTFIEKTYPSGKNNFSEVKYEFNI